MSSEPQKWREIFVDPFLRERKAELCKASLASCAKCLVDDNEALSFVKIKRGARDRASLVKSFSLKII